MPSLRGEIDFEHVTFRYRIDGPEVLHDVSFSIPSGQVIGIVGPSGSGKSTLAKLVQRLYVPESGRILMDGVDLATVDSSWLRRQMGIVLQDNILFNRSIRDNIALADPGIPTDRIIAAATLAGAHDFIVELPEGYDTIVGERGSSLSGGQRQRIAIARALLTEPRVMIFDEATSALDYESEQIFQRNLAQIAVGRTVFIIAHRLSTVRFADRILTLDHGRLVEEGTHDDLSARAGATRCFTECKVAFMKSAKDAIETGREDLREMLSPFQGARDPRKGRTRFSAGSDGDCRDPTVADWSCDRGHRHRSVLSSVDLGCRRTGRYCRIRTWKDRSKRACQANPAVRDRSGTRY